MPRVIIAEHAGACYGVERALSMALKAAQEARQPVHTLGPLIHNPLVVADLKQRGVSPAATPADARTGTLVVRAHGVTPQVAAHARELGLDVIDATCPYVKRVHHAAEKLAREGYQVLVIGESGHPEVQGIMGHAGDHALVVSSEEEIDRLSLAKRVGIVVQTTQTIELLRRIVARLVGRVEELRVVNTICEATSERQNAARATAREADCMIVVGGRESGNTQRLAQICHEACSQTHHIEDADELDPAWFAGVETIGITAGASTPAEHIERVRVRIHEIVGA